MRSSHCCSDSCSSPPDARCRGRSPSSASPAVEPGDEQVEHRRVEAALELEAGHIFLDPAYLAFEQLEPVELDAHPVADPRQLDQLDLAAFGRQVEDADPIGDLARGPEAD